MRNVIFVFGSNTEGIHGAGAAYEAVKNWNAIHGQAGGRQGNSYAIVTKDLSKGERSVNLSYIERQLGEFNKHARQNQSEVFIVTAVGTGLAGFTHSEIKDILQSYDWPLNVYFNSELLTK